MTATTPIARSKSAALARVLDVLPKGYTRWTSGSVKPEKAIALANKFHCLYGIGLSPAKRLTRKKHGLANVVLVMYWPPEATLVHWLLLATAGTGVEAERWRDAQDKPRLLWLDYELVRYPARGQNSWTWRRTKLEMTESFALLSEHMKRRHHAAAKAFMEVLAHQPGFHGVREQSWKLFEYARSMGFPGPYPHLFYLQKLPHGEKLHLNECSAGGANRGVAQVKTTR